MNPLSVAEGKKFRLVIDLRHINQCLVLPKFKYEDLRSLSEVLDEGDWFFTWDLKSGWDCSIYHTFRFVLGVFYAHLPSFIPSDGSIFEFLCIFACMLLYQNLFVFRLFGRFIRLLLIPFVILEFTSYICPPNSNS